MGLVEPLPWDTEFFGFAIGRVDLTGATVESLRAVEEEARDLGLLCLYGGLDAGADPAAYHAQRFGYRLVEVGLLFDRPGIPFDPKPSVSVVRRGTAADMTMLDDAIRTLAPWSRYGADPRFGLEAARRMHHAWVERAATDPQRMLSIAEDPSGVTGVATHVKGGEVPRIDIMGVTKPGTGASWALMNEFFEWAGGGPVEAGPCAARNPTVLRFLCHTGFRVTSSRYLYHRWLDEEVVVP